MSELTRAKFMASLAEAMEKWVEKSVDEDGWDEVVWCPPDLSGLMARSALHVLEITKACSDVERS